MQSHPQSNLWINEYTISESSKFFSCGPLCLWYKKKNDELWIAYKYIDPDTYANELSNEPDSDIIWSRWVVNHNDKVRFTPVFPDRNVVVQPEYPFKIIQGAKAKIFVQVPIWIRIEESGKKEALIVEIPTVILSKTWFGNTVEGENCYWISSPARRNIEPDLFISYFVICPVQIINSSNVELNIEKLALRVKRLSIFNFNGQLWSDEIRISYRGNGEASRLEVAGKPPKEAPLSKLISKPRKETKKEILLDTAYHNPLCLQEPEPTIIFSGFGSSSIDLFFGVWAERDDWLTLKNSIQEEIKQRFDEEGIEIPFPHISLYKGSATEPFPVEIVEIKK